MRLWLAVVALSLLFPAASRAGDDPRQAALEALGKAYAQDAQASFGGVDLGAAVTVGAHPGGWPSKLRERMAVGYAPRAGEFRAIPFAKFGDLLKIEMAGEASPETIPTTILEPGCVVVDVTWRMGSAPPVRSLAVFSPEGQPLFDTLISLPLLKLPVFDVDHY